MIRDGAARANSSASWAVASSSTSGQVRKRWRRDEGLLDRLGIE
jgi:hypothetical protein